MFTSKRILIIIGVVTVVIVGGLSFGLAYALTHMNQASTASDSPTVTAVPPVTTPKPGNRACVLGIIQSVGSQSFVVSANLGKRTVTVNVDNQTTYARGGSRTSLSFTGLAVGDRVRVIAQGLCGRRDTTVVAQSVTVLPAASPTPAVSPSP